MSTTYMSLVLPTVSSTIGPLWASELNSALTVIDAHNHAAGMGQQISPSGLDISSDLSFQSNNATLLRSVRLAPQAAALAVGTDLRCIYAIAGDLYYNNASGTSVQITSGGSVAGTSGSIGNLVSPAHADYVSLSTEFAFSSAAGDTPANISGASLRLRNISLASKSVTLQAPGALAADYNVIFPAALPASQKIMTLDNSGNIAAAYVTDNTTLEVSSNNLRIKALGVDTAQIAASAVTSAKLATGAAIANVGNLGVLTANINDGAVTPVKRSTSQSGINTVSGSTCLNSTSSVPVTITGSSRPVLIAIASYGSNTASIVNGVDTTRSIRIKRNGSTLFTLNLGDNSSSYTVPIDGTWIDTTGGSGSLTYDILTDAGTAGPAVGSISLSVTEL